MRDRWAAAAAVPALGCVLGAALSGCGFGGDSGGRPTITVTVRASASPTPEASAPEQSAPPSSSAPTGTEVPADVPRTDRAFDAAYIVSSREQSGVRVVVIDRLTANGIADEVMAQQGVAVSPQNTFVNQRVATYDIGVSPAATFVQSTCTQGDGGPEVESAPQSAEQFLSSVTPDTPVILSYSEGLVTRAETNPRC